MLFKLKVAPKSDPSKKENKELLFVRHYCPSADEEPERDLSLRHLEWEHIDCRQGKRRKQQAHFAVVECSCVLQRASICPHFCLWDEGQFNHFLVIDMLELWPRHEMMPQKPFVHLDPPLKKRKRSNLKLPAG